MGVIEKLQLPAEKASDFFSWFNWLLLLCFRVYVAWVFLKSGMHKIGDWETTLVLFEYEYQVPLLNFELAAYLATFGELVFPLFLIA
ncbi:MAG: DoxX family protein, partial [Gammaproteobacteria bacterium]